MTVWFATPNLSDVSGGVQVIHDLAASLRERGVDARIWLPEPRLPRVPAPSAPEIVSPRLDARPGDRFIVPEVAGPNWHGAGARVPYLVLNQSHFFTHAGLEFDEPEPARYPGQPDAVGVIATSERIERFVREAVRGELPIVRLPIVLDVERFLPAPKERVIAFMPRRRKRDLVQLVQLLRARDEARGWRFEAIDGVSPEEVASRLGTAAIFLAGSERDGFGLPPAEALAAGCLVAGFAGDGGLEFLTEDTALVARSDDLIEARDLALRAIREFEAADGALAPRAEAGRALVSERYTRERFEEGVDRVAELLEDPAGALADEATLTHWWSAPQGSAVRRLARRVRSAAKALRG